MCNFLRQNNALRARRRIILFSHLPQILGLKKVAHRLLVNIRVQNLGFAGTVRVRDGHSTGFYTVL